MISFILRDMTEDDRAFLYNSFLKSYHCTTPIKYTPHILYYGPQSTIIDYLTDHSNVLIACFPEEPDQIIGYIIYDNTDEAFILHYIYIKNMYRWKNIASSIISQLSNKSLIIATHINDNFDELKHKIPHTRVAYDPFLIQKRMRIL